MNKRELATAISNMNGISQKEAMDRLDQVFDIIMDQLAKREEVKIRGFGTFKTSKREERIMYNPSTGEDMTVPERFIPVFTPGKTLRDKVRGDSK